MYNGNIAAGSINIPQLNGGAYWLDKVYTYDQLNRIKSATAYHTASVSSAPVKNGDYNERLLMMATAISSPMTTTVVLNRLYIKEKHRSVQVYAVK